MYRNIVASAGFAFALVLAASAAGWEGELAGSRQPISVVIEKAESNDFVVVEGTVADVRSGDGSLVIVIFEDETGTVPLVIPNHLQRHFAGGTPAGGEGPTGADPEIGRRARVGGTWHHKPLEDHTGRIRVQRVESLED